VGQIKTHGTGLLPWQVAAPPVEKVPMGQAMGSDVFAGHIDPTGQRNVLLLAQTDPAGQTVHASCALKNMPGAQPV
jgi:hypothetical protein